MCLCTFKNCCSSKLDVLYLSSHLAASSTEHLFHWNDLKTMFSQIPHPTTQPGSSNRTLLTI